MLNIHAREIPSRRAHELLDRFIFDPGHIMSPFFFPKLLKQTVAVQGRRVTRGMGVSRWVPFRKLRRMSIQMDRPGQVLETVPFCAHHQMTATTSTPHIQDPPVRATVSTDPTAVGTSNVAGDTPWTSLGPIFLGNLAIFHTTQPLPALRARLFRVERFSPNGRYFSLSEATDGEYSPLLSLICPCQTFRSTKATPRADFGGNLLFTFWGTTSKKRRFVGGSLLHSTPAQL